MPIIKQADFIQSIADSLQFISCYHSTDFVQAMAQAYAREESDSARDAIAQILINSRLSAEGKRPICQDTGIVVVFLKIGMGIQWESSASIEDMVNEGVRRAYLDPHNPLRASILNDPESGRINTKDNTPAVIYQEVVQGDTLEVIISAKGGGSENKARLAMLNPSDSIVDWVLSTVPTLGAGWCPPGIIGLGIGGTPEKAMLLAKQSLMAPIDLHKILKKPDPSPVEALRLDLYTRINALGIGAQGLGGKTTVLDVKVLTYPTHAASKPVALIPNCAATRHTHFTLDGSGPAQFTPPPANTWPDIDTSSSYANHQRVHLDTLTHEEVQGWRQGQTLLLNGKILTGRDAAHKRIVDLIENNKPLPVNFKGRIIYYVGPVQAAAGEVVGPAGPTTATRMDKFTQVILEKTGIFAMIGKAERGQETVDLIAKHKVAYLIAVGGAAYLVSKAIKSSKVVAFEDLGMEAVHEFEVEDMPVTVAVDSLGQSVHHTAPLRWRQYVPKNAKTL